MVNIIEDRVFDWKPRFDEQSRGFRAISGVEDGDPQDALYTCNFWLNQGEEGACVGFGHTHNQGSTPDPVSFVNEDLAFSVYHLAQTLDDWEGEDYEGTSVLAGAKAFSQINRLDGQPYIQRYEWAFSLREALLALSHKGGLVIGVNWYRGMFRPDSSSGFIFATGDVLGGHCVFVRGVKYVFNGPGRTWDDVNYDKSYIIIHNSWGRDWGVDGECYLSLTDFEKLIHEDAELCLVTKTPLAVTPTPSAGSTLDVAITDQAVADLVRSRAARQSLNPAEWITNRLRTYFGIR